MTLASTLRTVAATALVTLQFVFPSAIAAEGIRSPLCFWEYLDWDEMQSDEQKAWTALGWKRANWDSEESSAPASESKDWNELNSEEQKALELLGYTKTTWDSFDTGTCTNDRTTMAPSVDSEPGGSTPPVVVKDLSTGVTLIAPTAPTDAEP